MNHFTLEISDTELLQLQKIDTDLFQLLNQWAEQVSLALGEFRRFLTIVAFSTRYNDLFMVNEALAGGLQIYVNPLLISGFDERAEGQLLQTFVASLNESDDIFDICVAELAHCSEILAKRYPISLRIAPSFCDGKPRTLRQLKPEKVESLVSLLSNTFLPISSPEVRCLREEEHYSNPIARVIDANGILSLPLDLRASDDNSDGESNGSYLGILSEAISNLVGAQEGIPHVFKQMLRKSEISVSLDDQVPTYYTNGSENVLEDYLPERIHMESGGGDAGSFLDAPGTCVPVSHFLLAEQSTEHQYNIMTIQEYWVRICLKTAPPSSYMRIGEHFDEDVFDPPGIPLLILQISSIKSDRKSYFEYLDSMSIQEEKGDNIVNIGGNESVRYNYRLTDEHTVYRIPEDLLHFHEIQDMFPREREDFEVLLRVSFASAILSALQQCYGAVFKYLLAVDINYSATKLKLLARDPSHIRYAFERCYWEVATDEAHMRDHDFGFDVVSTLVAQRRLEFRAEEHELQRACGGSYGRALVRKENLSNYALMALFDSTYKMCSDVTSDVLRTDEERRIAKQLDNAQFADILDRMLVQNEHCKFAIEDAIRFNTEVLFQNAVSDYSGACLGYYNIEVQDWQEFEEPELEQEIILRRRTESSCEQQEYVSFNGIALHQKRSFTLFPDMITINGVGLINDASSREKCVLELDLGFASPPDRTHLYLFYQQTYPLLITDLSKRITEALTLPYKFSKHELVFPQDQEMEMLVKNPEYRNSSYFLIPALWETFRVRRIVLSGYLEDHDLVDIFRTQNGETTIILRVVRCDKTENIYDFVGRSKSSFTENEHGNEQAAENPSESPAGVDCTEYQELIEALLPAPLTHEMDLIFSQSFTNLKRSRGYSMAPFSDVFECLRRKLRMERITGLLSSARTYQKYLLPIICSETQIVIPRHYPFLGERTMQSLHSFIIRFAEFDIGIPAYLKTHMHRILGACAFCYFGVGIESGVHAAALTGCELKFRRGKLSICVDSRGCEQIVKRHADVTSLETIADCRARLQYLNPTMMYYVKDKIVLYSLLERKNDFYYFVIDNKFRLAVLAVPVSLYLSEFSPEIFSRSHYRQNAACIISDGDILLENNQLCIYFAERSIERYAAFSDSNIIESESAVVIRSLLNSPQFINLRIEALRFFLADVDCIFQYKMRSYAHLQSFWAVSAKNFASWSETMFETLELCTKLPLFFSTAVNAALGTHFREKRVVFPLNLLFVDSQAESVTADFLPAFFTALRCGREMLENLNSRDSTDNGVAYVDDQIDGKQTIRPNLGAQDQSPETVTVDITANPSPITPTAEDVAFLLRPATVVSQHGFAMLDEIDAERVLECEMERKYSQKVGYICNNMDLCEAGSCFCVAEPSFCGFLLVVSLNPRDWENYARACGSAVQGSDLRAFAAVTMNAVVDEFAQTALLGNLV